MGNQCCSLFISVIKKRWKSWKNPSTKQICTSNEVQLSSGLIRYRSAWYKKNDEPRPIFPTEIIIEILSWLPLKSLTQFQLVCKEWRAIAHDHHFIEKHMSRSSIVWQWHNSTPVTNLFSRPEHKSFAYIHGCDGLVLIKNNSSLKYFIWNPAISLVLELPDPHGDSYGFALTYVPATKNYRVVSFYKDNESGRRGCQVFTPGHSKTWKRLAFPDFANANEETKKEKFSVVSAGRDVHCVLMITGNKIVSEIVTLDVETECFTVNHLPQGLFRDNARTVSEMDWDGKLAIAEIAEQELQFIELEDHKKQRWSETKKIIPLPFMKTEGYNEKSVIPLITKPGEIWFWLRDEKIFIYRIKTRQVVDIKKSQAFAVANKIYTYKPSLISFEGMAPDTHLERIRPKIRFD